MLAAVPAALVKAGRHSCFEAYLAIDVPAARWAASWRFEVPYRLVERFAFVVPDLATALESLKV